ncbi:MAG: TM2 domain-containing protein [Pirellulaceae bacterium]
MSPFTQVVCSHCSQPLRVTGATAGRHVRCPQCQAFIRVPDAPGSEPTRQWRLRTQEGRLYGPVSRAELTQWVREGRVNAHCQVSPADSDKWMWAAELFAELSEPALDGYAAPRPPVVAAAPRLSERSRLVAGLLGLLLPLVGLNGIHRLYTGHIGLGILMLITCGGCGIWQLIDVILVFAGSVRDAEGLPLSP